MIIQALKTRINIRNEVSTRSQSVPYVLILVCLFLFDWHMFMALGKCPYALALL